MTDNGQGYYVLTEWASAGGANAAAVRTAFKNTYGEDMITLIGSSTHGLDFGAFMQAASRRIDAGASPDAPTLADINGAILEAGGSTPGLLGSIGKGLEATGQVLKEDVTAVAGFSLSALKYLAIIAVVGGAAYIAYQAGWLKKASRA